MASFPTFIVPSPMQGLQPMGVQYKPLDFSNLLKSLMLDRQKAASKTKTPKAPKEDLVKGRVGAVKQYYGNQRKALNKIAFYEKEYGDGAVNIPAYQQAVSDFSLYNRKEYISIIDRETKKLEEDKSFVNSKSANGNINLDLYNQSNGMIYKTNQDVLTEDELNASPEMPNAFEYTPNPFNQFNFAHEYSKSIYNNNDVDDELDQLFNVSNNQYNLDLDEKGRRKLINQISTAVVGGAGGNVDVLKTKKFKSESDLAALSFAEDQSLERMLRGQLNLTDPLVSGMYQTFLQKTSGGRDKYTYRETPSSTPRQLDLVDENGQRTQDHYLAFHDFASKYINSHLKKRYDQNIEETLSASKLADGGSGKRTKSDYFLNRPQLYQPFSSAYTFRIKTGITGLNTLVLEDQEFINNVNSQLSRIGLDQYAMVTGEDDDIPSVFESLKTADGSESIRVSKDISKIKEIIDELKKIDNKEEFRLEEISPLLESMVNGFASNKVDLGTGISNAFRFPGQKRDLFYDNLVDGEGIIPKLEETYQQLLNQQDAQIQQLSNKMTTQDGFLLFDATNYPLNDDITKGSGVQIGDKAKKHFNGLNVQIIPGTNHDGGALVGTVSSIQNNVLMTLGGEPTNWYKPKGAEKYNYYNRYGTKTVQPNFSSSPKRGWRLNTFDTESVNEIQAYAANPENWTNQSSPNYGAVRNFVGITFKATEGDFGALADMLNQVEYYTPDKDYNERESKENLEKVKRFNNLPIGSKVQYRALRSNEDEEIVRKELEDKGYLDIKLRKSKSTSRFGTKREFQYTYQGDKIELFDKESFAKEYPSKAGEFQEYPMFRKWIDNQEELPEVNGIKYIPENQYSKYATKYLDYKYKNNGIDVERTNMKREAKVEKIALEELTVEDITNMINDSEGLSGEALKTHMYQYLNKYAADFMDIEMRKEEGKPVFYYTVPVAFDSNIVQQLNQEARQRFMTDRLNLMKNVNKNQQSNITPEKQGLLNMFKK